MVEQSNEESSKKSIESFLNISKQLVELIRDTFLLALVVMLIAFPTKLNSLLVKAGFEEGSIVGLKWRAKLEDSDQTLKEARVSITNLTIQNEKLTKALSNIQVKSSDITEKQQLVKLKEDNEKLKLTSEKVEADVQATISANAPFVEKAQISYSTVAQWGVVYGGDIDIDSAEYEIKTIARKYELTNTAIFFRQGSFRSVAIASERSEANQLLSKAKKRRNDAYIVNMGKWCPHTEQKEQYIECVVK